MIEFKNLSNETPYLILKEKYDESLKANQQNIEAISISSYSDKNKEVNARYVNLKFVDDKKIYFFFQTICLRNLKNLIIIIKLQH